MTVAHIKLAHIFCAVTILAFRFNVDLPLPSKAIKVVDKRTAHKGLYGPIDVLDLHALLEHLVAVNSNELLRNIGQECCAHAANLGTLARRSHELAQIFSQKLDILSRAVLQHKGKAA